jgi:hypothetical protein
VIESASEASSFKVYTLMHAIRYLVVSTVQADPKYRYIW